VLLSAKLE
jgi:hypothetical protein